MPTREEAYQEWLKQKAIGDRERNKARGILGKAPLPTVDPEMAMHRERLQELYTSPETLGLTEEEEQQYLAGVRRQGEDLMQSQGAAYDTWAARRGISGTPVANQRLKLMQELIRNMSSAKMNVMDMGFKNRTQARLAALQQLGGVASQYQDVSNQNYEAQLQEQLARDRMQSELYGYGLYFAGQQFLPPVDTTGGLG